MTNGFSNNWAWKGPNPKTVAKPSFSKGKKKKKAAARKKRKVDHEKRKAEMTEAREALKKITPSLLENGLTGLLMKKKALKTRLITPTSCLKVLNCR